ncbi:MAG TPA: OmpA family protein [Syntrophobacteraceae bacterium]|nr:OmpA family protein [Syntrophobacteraceae bacterium]
MIQIWGFSLLALLSVFFFGIPGAHAVSSALVHGKNMHSEVWLGMTKQETIDRIGVPSRIKSEGSCFHYDSLDVAVYFDSSMRAERIYLGRESRSGITRFAPGSVTMDDIFETFGPPSSTWRLTYTPSPLVQNRATVESESSIKKGTVPRDLPLEYRGQRVLYELAHAEGLLKYKYVLDDDGVAFWFDPSKTLYAAVLYPSATRDLPAVSSSGAQGSRTAVVYFDFDKFKVKPAYLPVIREYAGEMRQQPGGVLHIEGHTDSVGSARYNRRLSERRASSVARLARDQGVSKDRIKKVGFGESRPAATNANPQGRAQNRRVEMRIEPSP